MFGVKEGSEPEIVRTNIDPHGVLALMGHSIGSQNYKFTLEKSAFIKIYYSSAATIPPLQQLKKKSRRGQRGF